MTREITNKLIEMVEEGVITWESIAMACLVYMSEDDVSDMAHDNELYTRQERTEENAND
jgi:hypothetical protein